MNFDFSEDQRRLQDEVRRVLADHSTSAAVRRVLDGEAPFCAATWRELAALGALGLAIPETHGGAGMGLLELCLVAEEAGRALAAVPLLSSIYLAAETLRRAGSPSQQADWLPRLASGETVIAAVLDPRPHRVLKDAPLSLAGGRLSGVVNAVPDGMAADAALLLVAGQLLLVDLAAAGVERWPRSRSILPARSRGLLLLMRRSNCYRQPMAARLPPRSSMVQPSCWPSRLSAEPSARCLLHGTTCWNAAHSAASLARFKA